MAYPLLKNAFNGASKNSGAEGVENGSIKLILKNIKNKDEVQDKAEDAKMKKVLLNIGKGVDEGGALVYDALSRQQEHKMKTADRQAPICDCPFVQIHKVGCQRQKKPGLNQGPYARKQYKAILKHGSNAPRIFNPKHDLITGEDLLSPLYPIFMNEKLYIAIPRKNPPETLLIPGLHVKIIKGENDSTKLEVRWN